MKCGAIFNYDLVWDQVDAAIKNHIAEGAAMHCKALAIEQAQHEVSWTKRKERLYALRRARKDTLRHGAAAAAGGPGPAPPDAGH